MDEPSPKPPKTFTVAEANTLLPQVRPLIEQLQGLQRSILQANQQLDELMRKVSVGNGYPIKTIKQHIQDLTKRQLQLVESWGAS